MARIRKRGKKWSYEIRRSGFESIHGSNFATKKEASDEARRVEYELEQGIYNFSVSESVDNEAGEDYKLVDLFDEWLEVEILPQRLDVDTKKRYIRRRDILKEYFGEQVVSTLLRSQYQRFINDYGKRYEINEVGRMNANVRKAIDFALADKKKIDDSFLKSIKLISQKESKHPDLKFLHSREDYERLMEYLLYILDYRKSVVPHIIYFQFAVGLRPAEALALKWEDVDFENQEIYTKVRWSSRKHEIVPPKNDHYYRKINQRNPSIRKVPMNKQVTQVLKDLKKEQDKLLRLLRQKNPDNFVFFQIGAKWAVPDESTLNTKLKKILKELEIEPIISVYGARHTYGSIKVQEGVPIEVVSKWFGHKDTSTLRQTYLHLLRETKDEWNEIEKNK